MTFKTKKIIFISAASAVALIILILCFVTGYKIGKSKSASNYSRGDTAFISSFTQATPTDAAAAGDYEELNEALNALSEKGINWDVNYGMNSSGGREITITIDYPVDGLGY